MEVTFQGKTGQTAVFYPEYYENYDEIAPAHIFGRSIEGEGFRARQCFKEGVPDLSQYDTIFPKACAEEKGKYAASHFKPAAALSGQSHG